MIGFLTGFLYVLLAIVILLLMVVIHEFGHYVAGKLLKFKINEFSVGFGPKLLSKRTKGGELFSLRAVPLGGFCAFEGEEGGENEDGENSQEESEESKTKEQSAEQAKTSGKAFVDEKPYKRIIVFLAGATFNLVSAVIFSFIFIMVIGYATPVVDTVYQDPNENPYSALLKGDEIKAVNGKEISVMNTFEELSAGIKLGEQTVLTIIRESEEMTVNIVKKSITVDGDTYEGFGFSSGREYHNIGFLESLGNSVPFTLKMSWTILGSFGKLVTGQYAITELTGPVRTIQTIAEVSQANWRNILILLPLIASNLAVFNLLPIPALDGSKVLFTTIEWIRGKPVNRNVENIIHFVGLIALFSLVILIDIIAFFV